MPTQTQASIIEPEVLSPQWLYDTLMEVIEPDLMTANIHRLDEKYKNESDEDQKIRMERYEWAFVILDESILDIKEEMKEDAAIVQYVMKRVAELKTSEDDQERMNEIEDQFNSNQSL